MKHRYTYIFLFLFLSIGNFCKAADPTLDSLSKVYSVAKNDTSRVWTLLNMVDVLYRQNIDSAKKTLVKSLQINDKLLQHDSLYPVNKQYTAKLVYFEAEACGGLGYLYFVTDDPDKGLRFEKRALDLFRTIDKKKDLGQAYNNMGYMNNEKGDLYTAIHYYDTALTLRKEIKDSDGIATIINSLGYAYQQLDDTARAIQYFKEALDIRIKIHDKIGIATTLNNLATIKSQAGKITDAISYYKQALEYAKQAKSKAKYALLTDNLASCYEKIGQLDTAFAYANRSLKAYTELNDKEGVAYAMSYIGVIYTQKNKTDSAKRYFDKAFVIANQLKYKALTARLADYSGRLYKSLGDYKKAYEMYVLYKETTDSLNNKKAEKEALRTQLKYDYQKKEIEQQEKQKQEELAHNEELKRQHIIIAAISLGILFLAGFMFVLASRLKIIRRQKVVIERQKLIVEEKNKDMTDSIQYASRIQQTILPETAHVKELFPDSFVLWKPKDIVSGDFYWISNTKGLRYILTADCTGHGVPGALMSMVGAELFNEAVKIKGLTKPSEVLTDVRTGIISALRQKGNMGEQKDGMDASLCVFEKPSTDGSVTMHFAGANNPLWIVRKNNEVGSFEEIAANKLPIGIHGDILSPFTERSIELHKGDIVYLFSDGYADQFGGPKGKKFKYSQLRELLIGFSNTPLDEQSKKLEKTFQDWKGELEQVDDVLIIGIRI